jgi:hypothetical protein
MGQIATGNPSAGGGGLGSLFSAFTGNARTRILQQRADEAAARDAARAAQAAATAKETARHNQADEKIRQDQEAGRVATTAAAQRRADEQATNAANQHKIDNYWKQVQAARQQYETEGTVRQQALEGWQKAHPAQRPDLPAMPVAPQLQQDPYTEYSGPSARSAVEAELEHNLEQRIGAPPADPNAGMGTAAPVWGAKGQPNLLQQMPSDFEQRAIPRVMEYLKAGHSIQEAVANTEAEMLGTHPTYTPGVPATPLKKGWFTDTPAVPATLPTIAPETTTQIQPMDLSEAIKLGPYASNEAAKAKQRADLEAYNAAKSARESYQAPVPPPNLTDPRAPLDYSTIPVPDVPGFVPAIAQRPPTVTPVPTPPTPPTMSTPAQTVAPATTAPAATAPATTAPAVPTADSNAPTAATEPPTTWKKTKGGIVYSD